MYNRASDFSPAGRGTGEFVIRRRIPPLWQLVAVFLASFLFVLWLALVGDSMEGHSLFVACTLGVIAFLTWFTVFFTQRTRDLLLATEFQNALFASATTLHTQFCLITKQDGTIVYYDPGFQQVFPEFMRMEERAIDMLLSASGASEADREKVFSALNRHVFEKLVIAVRAADGKQRRIMLTIDPLPRPKGFFLFRGREYIEHRSAAQPGDAGPALSSLMHHLPVGMYAANRKGELTFINQTLELWLGYSPGEMMARRMHLQNLLYPADHKASALEPDHFEGIVTLYRKNGSLLKVSLRQQVQSSHADAACIGTVLLEPQAEPERKLVATRVDSLPHAQSTAENERSFIKLQTFIDNSPVAIAQLDRNGYVLDANDALLQLVGRTRQAGNGWRLEEVIAETNRSEFAQMIERALGGEPSRKGLATETTHDGTKATVSLFVSRMDTGDDQPLAMVHMIDTTEQKNLEMRFAHSQKMQAVGQLAGGIAHDFNNLLTAMIGFCDLLLMRHPAGDQSFADIMQIKQNANRAANLVRQLLAFSRRQTLQPKVVDLTDVLAELSNLVRRLIGENIELKMVHGRDLGMVKADQGQLEQVLINLAVNARDAMPQGGGSLTVRTSNVSIDRRHPLDRSLVSPSEEDVITPGDYVLCEVSDTGTGIPRDMMQKIFEPFFSTKEIGSGTGLGLATCYGIVKQTGGFIYVSSAVGQGTTFHLYFPRVEAKEAAQAVQESEAETRGVTTTDLTGKGTILLVEDETPVRIFAARALRNKGYTVIEADNGENALEMMEQHGPTVDVIITDVIMPGMNGPQMIEKVVQTYPDIRVIFISGYAEDAFVKTYGTEREFNFLPKPFTLKQLASKVKEVVGGKTAG